VLLLCTFVSPHGFFFKSRNRTSKSSQQIDQVPTVFLVECESSEENVSYINI
jgi:hypothetical protein